MRDRPAGFAAEVLLTALGTNDGRRLGEELPDLAELARNSKRIDAGPGLVGLDETVHQCVEARERFFQWTASRPRE